MDSTEGLIHYSYYLPEDYDPTRKYPMMVVMPGYNMMWFGESSSGSNLDWTGFTSWTNLGQDMIIRINRITISAGASGLLLSFCSAAVSCIMPQKASFLKAFCHKLPDFT